MIRIKSPTDYIHHLFRTMHYHVFLIDENKANPFDVEHNFFIWKITTLSEYVCKDLCNVFFELSFMKVH